MKPRELVDALRAMGLTQMQIQERTGIPQPTVSKIGLGKVRDIMSRHYVALLAAYEHQISVQPAQPVAAPPQTPAPGPFKWPRIDG